MELAHIRNDRTIRCVVFRICYGERYSVADRVECFNGLRGRKLFIAAALGVKSAEKPLKVNAAVRLSGMGAIPFALQNAS